MDRTPSFDRLAFMTNFQGMEDLAYETVESFLSTVPGLLSAIERAIQSGDASALEISAHTLKGAASNFQAEPTVALAFRLERMGHDRNFQEVHRVFSELKIALEEFTIDLNALLRERIVCMSKLPILVVDDSDFDRAMLVKALAMKGNFITLEANSGEKCLEILDSQVVGIVLIDILMPGVHGTEVLKKIRERFNAIELPIIMVTSKSETIDVIGCLQSGANDYITKPVNFEIAVSRITTHLKIAELSHEMSKLKEMAALDAMITTYNHEINNPLAIALACLGGKLVKDEKVAAKLKASLWRVADIVKKIKEVKEKKEVEYQQYVGSTKMVKIR